MTDLQRTTDSMADRLADAIDRDLARARDAAAEGTTIDLMEYVDRRNEVRRSCTPSVLAALRARGWTL